MSGKDNYSQALQVFRTFRIFHKEQESFGKFRGTTDTLLRVTQDICNGFNRKEKTAALFIDIEKAYDSVWCEGLLFKLKEMGIRGRVWAWIRDFLTDRRVVINMAGERAQEFDTNTGLPQGSIISLLLFVLFVADCYKEVSCEKVKFADDGTIWKTGKNWLELLEELKMDFRHVCQWASMWRVKLSILKTEFCIFSLDNHILENARTYNFTIDGRKVQYNPTPKVLGATLDEKLKFETQTEQLERKASKRMRYYGKWKKQKLWMQSAKGVTIYRYVGILRCIFYSVVYRYARIGYRFIVVLGPGFYTIIRNALIEYRSRLCTVNHYRLQF